MVDAGKQKSIAVFCSMKELFQHRLPPSFGLHPQECFLHWWEGTHEFSLFHTWLNIRIERFVVYWSVQRISSVACWHCNLLCRSRFYVCTSRLCLLYWRICYIYLRFVTVYRGSIPYISLLLSLGHRILLVTSKTSLNRGLLNCISSVPIIWIKLV